MPDKQPKTLVECFEDIHDAGAALFYVSYGVWYGYYVRMVLCYRRYRIKHLSPGEKNRWYY